MLTQQAIAGSPLNVSPTVVNGTLVLWGLSPRRFCFGRHQPIDAGWRSSNLGRWREAFTITGNGMTETFELTRDATVATGNVRE